MNRRNVPRCSGPGCIPIAASGAASLAQMLVSAVPGVMSFNTRTGAVTLTAADVDAALAAVALLDLSAAAADVTIKGPAGKNVLLSIGATECARLANNGLRISGNGPLMVSNGSDLQTTARNASLGGVNVNNVDPGSCISQRWSATAAINVTGMVAGGNGELRYLWNVGAFAVTLTNQDAGSNAANRWLTTTGANLVLNPNQCAMAYYDNATAAWRVTLLP